MWKQKEENWFQVPTLLASAWKVVTKLNFKREYELILNRSRIGIAQLTLFIFLEHGTINLPS